MSLAMFAALALIVWSGWGFFLYTRVLAQELGRFKGDGGSPVATFSQRFDMLVASLVTHQARRRRHRQSLRYHVSKSERDMERKLRDAGLETAAEQGKFLLFRSACYVSGPIIGLSAYTVLPPYYATICTLMSSCVGVLIPMFWLKGKIVGRSEEIQRELPLILDLTNLGTSAGWDISSSLERVIDALYAEFPEHPLLKELKRARWLAASGYTWEEALRRVSVKLNNETVSRTTISLGQAIRQGGDRTKQLEGIAEDAQRIYYSELDKRLAALPVKALLATMLIMIAYFCILLAPAAVQVKQVLH